MKLKFCKYCPLVGMSNAGTAYRRTIGKEV